MDKLAIVLSIGLPIVYAASEKHQLIGGLNDMDDDGVVFWGATNSKEDEKVKLVRSILVFILTVVILLGVAWLIYKAYQHFRGPKNAKK